MSVLLLLCVGVLLIGMTLHSFADSYTVNAVVPAPLPTSPAVITSPVDQSHFTSTPITISGTCPQNTYVDLLDNNIFSGSAICNSNQTTFEINTNIFLGSNSLVAQDYNITNQPGPTSAPITVFLDNPVQPVAPIPTTPPITLQVTSQDGIPYSSGVTTKVSPYVTERGTAPPGSRVAINFNSASLTCITYADSNGNWSCTLDQALPIGINTVNVMATTPNGQILTLPAFYIRVSGAVQPLQPTKVSTLPFFISSSYEYKPRISGQAFSIVFSLSGGVAPYAMTINWGDGSQSTIVRSNGSSFSLSHTYNLPTNLLQQTYLIKAQAVDSKGSTAFLQIAEIVHGKNWYPGAALTTNSGSSSNSSLPGLKQLLWLLWPTYGVVILMVLSFWLGERQEYYSLSNRRRHLKHARL
jgi:hypothetical protein